MTSDSYLTIAEPANGIYKEKSSKFLSFAYPVNTESEIRNLLQHTRKEYYDARHVCYAYILGTNQSSYNASDGGEPAHTAGDPILNEIRSAGLTNILVIVVRYFGGTKLGKSGLIAAYKEAARDSISQSKIVEKTETAVLTIQFEYAETSKVQNIIHEIGARIVEQTFEIKCCISLEVPKNKYIEARKKLEDYLLP